ncbi:unnamed protein product [Rotaria sp. Silwood2]|nr:unnamed protein product [Rotaria sp. Silwood2]CAF2510226.1 unnamed protein product [Rotaria sp. Silwood2]CAF2884096.1 unnamed protein product [Rotaria sp. Silwood2]CAF4259539.1 unnamed protein product [Rotaria sp. Silwood2]CAF4367195.1 unnamed protein product [Rotaria sp. Silwood2]
MYFFFILLIFLNLLLFIQTIQIQRIKVRENVNVTMTCRLNTRENLLTTNYLASIPSLTSFNKIFDNNYSGNIILWYKDDIQVIGVNSISNDPQKYIIHQENFYTYQLIILNVQLESSGLYKCQNFTAKEENLFQLNVMVPPSRLRLSPSPQMPVADGTSVLFNCTSERAYPVPTFEWYKNDKLIQRSIGMSINNETNTSSFSSSSLLTLILSPIDHDHVLRCQVTNEASIHDTNVELKLDVLFKPIINISWNQKQSPTTLTVIENRFETIHCIISANPSVLANIEWFKNDQLIRGENQEQLRINFTRIENIQKLTCRGRNTIGQSEATVNVDILYKPKLSMIDRITLNQGEKLVLKCSIDSNPMCHQIQWFHNSKQIHTQSCSLTNRTQTITEYIIPNVYRIHSGQYTCLVKNWLNTGFDNRHEATTEISTNVRIQYAPFILNSIKKLAVTENHDITTECIVDAYPKSDIVWFGPSGQRLSSFAEEKILNATVISSILHLPPSYSSMLGLYRCVAKNEYGQHDFSINFQRPGLPDPPNQLQAINITHSSFILTWQSAYNGGSTIIYHISLTGNRTEERQTSLNSIRFTDLNEKSRYFVKIRSKNTLGFSDYSSILIVLTNEYPFHSEEFPIIQRAYYTTDGRRIHFQLNQYSSSFFSKDQLCLQHYHISLTIIETTNDLPTCIPLNSLQKSNDELEIVNNQTNIRLKLCLINQTDICSKSISIPTGVSLSNDSSDLILILIGAILGLCFVAALIGLFICIQQQRRKEKSKHSSMNTLKTNFNGNQIENFHATPVRVVDTNSCLYYPAQTTTTINQIRPNGTLFYNQEIPNGIYSIQEKKNSMCFDSGMPSTTSNNSDSACSQAFSSSDIDGHIINGFYDRTDGENFVNGRIITKPNHLPDLQQLFLTKFNGTNDIPPYTIGARDDNHLNLTSHGRMSSEEESGFSTPTKSHHGKKLVYEVVV